MLSQPRAREGAHLLCHDPRFDDDDDRSTSALLAPDTFTDRENRLC
jgi:hypothetical protein